MIEPAWRYAFASITGAAHHAARLPCQDACECVVLYRTDGASVLVAAISDGAGSAPRSQAGSALACRSFVEQVGALVAGGGTAAHVTRDWVVNWLQCFNEEIELLAAAERRSAREFACTFLATVIDPTASAFCQIGDGAIVVSGGAEQDEFLWVFWPQHGEYANQTNFAVAPCAEKQLDYDLLIGDAGAINEVVLFTDGIERMVMDFSAQTIHAPFFRAILTPLRVRPGGFSLTYSDQIGTFLSGSAVTSRGDDDKTIVVATRRSNLASR